MSVLFIMKKAHIILLVSNPAKYGIGKITLILNIFILADLLGPALG